VRAVIFDLWDTLVEWPPGEGERIVALLAGLSSLPVERFEPQLNASYRALNTTPLTDAFRSLGIAERHLATAVAAYHDLARRTLRLRPGGREALDALRGRGLALGMISVCSEDVPALWPDTDLAGLFDVETFSATCGLMKPDPAIYLLTLEALGVAPGECLFVGDGANDELAGAARVGIEPVLYLPAGTICRWPDLRDWRGLRVSSLQEVVALC
jgi:putative hydrolase of the HAD superfamily